MLIRLGYDIEFYIPQQVTIVALLNVHPSRAADLLEPDEMNFDPQLDKQTYLDRFGNRCTRFLAPQGQLRIWNSTLIQDSGKKDPVNYNARQYPVIEVPAENLIYLMNSRYCEVDLLSNIASQLFGHIAPGWGLVQAIVDWVHDRVQFGYQYARATRTALEVYNEGVGVCRDFQHLAVAFCRCMHVPARYATGYLGDIGVPLSPVPMDFSAWFEVYLDGRWWAFDARHNEPRIGRILMATGRDAADVAITTSFGSAHLSKFTVVTEEVAETSTQSEARSQGA
ncbi:MAG TPA: transglutaminase family protein [Candidatus Acidoferrales bacterium]|nr:transglutaminase family protein [Candidatus Acidoferrales bacterium]